MRALDAPLLSRGELMDLDADRLVEKILGLRNDIADDAEELASLRQELDALAAALRTERAAREAAEAREHRHSEALRVRDEAIADIAEALGLDADTPTAPIAQVAAAAVARADAADARSATLLMCGEAAERAAAEAHAHHAALAGAVRAEREARYRVPAHYDADYAGAEERARVGALIDAHDATVARLDALLAGAPCGYVEARVVRAYLAAQHTATQRGATSADVDALRAARTALDTALAAAEGTR